MTHSILSDIIEAVANAEGADPLNLEYRLADYIDPDAIGALLDHDSAAFTLTFELSDNEVTVTDNETVLVETGTK